ncbi:MAG: hypothetical protein RIE56_12665, partial [Amphiplicatus sp.]
MKLKLIAATAGAFALLLAACGQKTEDATSAAPAETAAEEAMPAMGEAQPPMEEAADATADAPACVKDVPSGSICLMDINACGFSSGCDCGEGYTYNAALGKCLLDLDGVGEASVVQVEDTQCAMSAAASSRCTRDINACGQPSNCSCEDGFVWNDVAGKCLKDLTAPT